MGHDDVGDARDAERREDLERPPGAEVDGDRGALAGGASVAIR
jgi:hypothetical protein